MTAFGDAVSFGLGSRLGIVPKAFQNDPIYQTAYGLGSVGRDTLAAVATMGAGAPAIAEARAGGLLARVGISKAPTILGATVRVAPAVHRAASLYNTGLGVYGVASAGYHAATHTATGGDAVNAIFGGLGLLHLGGAYRAGGASGLWDAAVGGAVEHVSLRTGSSPNGVRGSGVRGDVIQLAERSLQVDAGALRAHVLSIAEGDAFMETVRRANRLAKGHWVSHEAIIAAIKDPANEFRVAPTGKSAVYPHDLRPEANFMYQGNVESVGVNLHELTHVGQQVFDPAAYLAAHQPARFPNPVSWYLSRLKAETGPFYLGGPHPFGKAVPIVFAVGVPTAAVGVVSGAGYLGWETLRGKKIEAEGAEPALLHHTHKRVRHDR